MTEAPDRARGPEGYELAVIRGDGIGPEIVDAALSIVPTLCERYHFSVHIIHLDGGADTYRRTGTALSPEAIATVRAADAMLKGPVGLPDVRLADGTEAGLLGGVLRGGLDCYANVRPIMMLPGIVSRLRADPGSIDYVIVRENTEGMYASRGKGVGNSWAMADTMIITRPGTERVARFAFELARQRHGAPTDGISRVTCVDKANVLASTYLFREVFLEVARDYPDVAVECRYVDACAQALVVEPEHFDVIVTENLFGDVLSDLGGATVGGIALCPSGNIGEAVSYFEPIHGSAPDIAGSGRANPIGQILSLAMALDHLGVAAAAAGLRRAVAACLEEGRVVVTADGSIVNGPLEAAAAIVALL